jgi:hypothetical protein
VWSSEFDAVGVTERRDCDGDMCCDVRVTDGLAVTVGVRTTERDGVLVIDSERVASFVELAVGSSVVVFVGDCEFVREGDRESVLCVKSPVSDMVVE